MNPDIDEMRETPKTIVLNNVRSIWIVEVTNNKVSQWCIYPDTQENRKMFTVKEDAMKPYYGRVPACGVFCGGCPLYVREKNPCPGAEINTARCEKCKSFHLCCEERGIAHCYECKTFPCYRFKRFSKNWEKYGQDFIENQKLLKELGKENFLNYFNSLLEEE